MQAPRASSCKLTVDGGGQTTRFVDGVPVGPSPEAGPNVTVRQDSLLVSGVVEMANSVSHLQGSCGLAGGKITVLLWRARSGTTVLHMTHPESYRAHVSPLTPGQYRVFLGWKVSADSVHVMLDTNVTVEVRHGGRVPGAAAEAPPLDPTRFEPEIRAFESADRASPPPLGGTVFVGSSSIKNWTDVAADFPGLPVLNRGFGGSTLADVVYYADRVVLPYHPRLVVLYAGDNDLAEGRTPGRVLGDYRTFVARLRSTFPAARIVYVSIKPSPSRRIYVDRMRETNRRIRAETERDSLQAYVDVFTPMLDATGQPRPELFLSDSLHMTRAGYLLWRALLAQVVH